MWQATRKAAELIKLVTYCNNVNAYCANLSCTHPHAHTHTHSYSLVGISYRNYVCLFRRGVSA